MACTTRPPSSPRPARFPRAAATPRTSLHLPGEKSNAKMADMAMYVLDNSSDVTDEILYKYNMGACILHGVQGLLMLIASQAVKNIKNFKKQLSTSFLIYNNNTRSLEPATKVVKPKVVLDIPDCISTSGRKSVPSRLASSLPSSC